MARKEPSRRGAVAESPTTTYVETSALLAALLEQDQAAQALLRNPGRKITSALTLAEANRGVVRAKANGRLSAPQERRAIQALQTFAARCDVISIAPPILERAGRPFPVEPVRTLDAIHLATLEFLGGPPQLVTVLTRDARVRDNARALGFATA